MVFLNCQEDKCDRQADWLCKECGKIQCHRCAKVVDEIGYCEECKKKMEIVL